MATTDEMKKSLCRINDRLRKCLGRKPVSEAGITKKDQLQTAAGY